jgi:hypothetical protein
MGCQTEARAVETSNETSEGLPVFSIYLCPKAKTLDRDAFVYAMMHELAHYAGLKENGIDEVAYFHRAPQKYANLLPTPTLRNADCYSQYAYDVIGKTEFNILPHHLH